MCARTRANNLSLSYPFNKTTYIIQNMLPKPINAQMGVLNGCVWICASVFVRACVCSSCLIKEVGRQSQAAINEFSLCTEHTQMLGIFAQQRSPPVVALIKQTALPDCCSQSPVVTLVKACWGTEASLWSIRYSMVSPQHRSWSCSSHTLPVALPALNWILSLSTHDINIPFWAQMRPVMITGPRGAGIPFNFPHPSPMPWCLPYRGAGDWTHMLAGSICFNNSNWREWNQPF